MDIRLITRHLDRSQELIGLCYRRAGYAFARFEHLIDRLEIRLSDLNGPRRGPGIACLARLHLAQGGDLMVEGVAESPEAGITRTLERLAFRFRRRTSRLHHRA